MVRKLLRPFFSGGRSRERKDRRLMFFTGIRGKGAFLNGNPIKVSSKDELVNCLLATETGTKRDKSTVDATTNRINSLFYKFFTGIRGKGAFLNGNPIKVSSKDELVNCLLATETGTKRDKSTVDATTNRINSLLYKVRSVRMSGSCALNLCGIACGRIDGGPWYYLSSFPCCLSIFILEKISGKEFNISITRIALSNPLIKDSFTEAFQQSG
ncbi:Inositol monophosphatase [Bienertia sinuspersici]